MQLYVPTLFSSCDVVTDIKRNQKVVRNPLMPHSVTQGRWEKKRERLPEFMLSWKVAVAHADTPRLEKGRNNLQRKASM